MNVLFATAELAPLARVGGLAQAAAGLVAALRKLGVDVEVVLPDYAATPLEDETFTTLAVPPWAGPATARHGHLDGVGPITLVSASGLERSHPYLEARGSGLARQRPPVLRLLRRRGGAHGQHERPTSST